MTSLGMYDREEERSLCMFLEVKNLVERETGRKIKCLRFDGGKEYFSDQFTSYLQKEGI